MKCVQDGLMEEWSVQPHFGLCPVTCLNSKILSAPGCEIIDKKFEGLWSLEESMAFNSFLMVFLNFQNVELLLVR